jgi:hypothetical protein
VTAPTLASPPTSPPKKEENMVSNAELRSKYETPQDYEDDFM